MDKQRAGRGGIANVFCIIPVRDAAVVEELRKVQHFCAELYPGFASCAADLETLHVTLVAAHACDAEAMARLTEAFGSFCFAAFELPLRGLGSWTTAGGKHVLFAEAEGEECVRLACALSRHLRERCDAAADGSFGAGSWIDVVEEAVFQPHLSLATVDPAEQPAVARAMAAKSGGAARGGGRKKLSARDKARSEGRRAAALEQQQQQREETFGREQRLFRHERKAFRKIVFGAVRVDCLHLERGFQVLAERRGE